MAKKFKINFDFKKFLLEKGERFGVGLAVGFAALLLLLGVWTGLGKTSPVKDLKEGADDLNKKVKDVVVDPRIAKPTLPVDAERDVPDPEVTPIWELMVRYNMEDNKKHNPQVLGLTPAKDWSPSYRVQFLRAPVRQVEYNRGEDASIIVPKMGGAVEGQKYPFAEKIRPVRMVIVSATFNYKAQLKAFAAALRAKSLKDLKQFPQFLGFYLYRRTTLPNGKVQMPEGQPGEWETLLPKKDGTFHNLLSASPDVVVEDSKQKDYFLPGMVMPRPVLAPGFSYPALTDLSGIPKPAAPRKGAERGQRPERNGGDDKKSDTLKWADLSEEDRKRLSGESVDVLDVNNPFGSKKVARTEAVSFTKDVGMIRFIDVDVKPGHTYDYSFVVRLANPNLGKDNEVAALKFAQVPELLSNYNFVSNVRIPPDVKFYSVDELALDPKGFNKQTAMLGSDFRAARANEGEVAVQVHRWVERIKSQSFSNAFDLGEWLAVERLLMHRGEFLGKMRVVEVPKWNQFAKQYQLALVKPTKGARVRKTDPKGLEVDFTFVTDPKLPPAILADFDGGRQLTLIDPGGEKKKTVTDESAAELLVLTPEGKLMVRDGRLDSDPETPAGKERQDRYEAWKSRINGLHGTGKGPKGPGETEDAFKPKKRPMP